jgi:hypothetical protein
MGIKLMVEILDHWQDAGLTVGERSDLLVLAENANDGSRLTFGPVHTEYILRRAGKTPKGWKNAVGKLLAKKVLTVHTPGRINQAAVYRLERLCSEARHDGHKGMCVRPPKENPERVTPEVTLSTEEGHRIEEEGHLSGEEGHPAGAERVTPEMTPTPPNPSFKNSSTTPSTSPTGPVDDEPAVTPEATDGGGGGDLRSLATHITDQLDYRGAHPTKTQQQQIRDRLLAALTAGWSMGGLAVYLHLGDAPVRSAAAVYAHRLSPEQLPAPGPSPAPPAARGGVRGPVLTGAEVEAWEDAAARAASRLDAGYRPFECPPASAYSNHGFGTGAGTDARVAGHVALTRELARREAQAHTPYSNDTWSRPATPAEAARVPWCGHTDCNETDRMRDVEDADGFKAVTQCPDCHPAVAWPA